METPIQSYIQELFQKYIQADIPNRFSLKYIHHHLKETYMAVELDSKYYEGLKADPFVDFEHIIGMYSITNLKILGNLYSSERKIDIFELMDFYKTFETYPDDKDNELAKMWKEVQEGRRINIILESEDGCYLSGFTIQGNGQRIYEELLVMQGLDLEECVLGSHKFHQYLKSLLHTGYLQIKEEN